MQGNLWLDTKQSRLAGISGRLTREVKFAGGFLGHLDPGWTARTRRQRQHFAEIRELRPPT
jgi:hypothetical protein